MKNEGWLEPLKKNRRERALAFGRKLTQWRLATDPRMTQTQAAAKAGISRSQWSRLERGECLPEHESVKAVAEAVGGDVAFAEALAGKSDYFTNAYRRPTWSKKGKRKGAMVAEDEKLERRLIRKKLRDLTVEEFDEVGRRPYIYAAPARYQALPDLVQSAIVECWNVISTDLENEHLDERDVGEVLAHLELTTAFYLYRVKPFEPSPKPTAPSARG